MYELKLFIDKKDVYEAARNNDFLGALSFCVMVKAAHRNSMLLNYTWKKVMSLCRCNLAKAKRIVYSAYEYGLIRFEGKDNRHIVCNAFRKYKRQRCTVLHVHVNDDGTQHIYIQSNYKKKGVYERQTISGVEDVILSLGLLLGIGGYKHTINTWLRNVNELKKELQFHDLARGVRKRNYDIISQEDPSTNPFKRGYSLDMILQNIYENSISRYKLTQLIKKMKKDGLLKVYKNYYKFRTIKNGEDGRLMRPRDLKKVVVNHFTGKKESRNGSIFIEKHRSDEEKTVYFRRMANGYECTADYSHYKKNWKIINSKPESNAA